MESKAKYFARVLESMAQREERTSQGSGLPMLRWENILREAARTLRELDRKDTLVCKSCGREIDYVGNFCTKCNAKLYDVCPECWQHSKQPYNCGQDRCPEQKKAPAGAENTEQEQTKKLN